MNFVYGNKVKAVNRADIKADIKAAIKMDSKEDQMVIHQDDQATDLGETKTDSVVIKVVAAAATALVEDIIRATMAVSVAAMLDQMFLAHCSSNTLLTAAISTKL